MQSILGKFSAKTLIGLLVSGLVIVFQAFGVNIHDLAPSLSVALANFANAAAALVPLGFAVWGHIQLAKKHAALVTSISQAATASPDTSASAPPVRKLPLPLALAASLSLGLLMSGCASSAGTTTVTTANGAAVPVPNEYITIGDDIVSYLQTFNTGATAVLPDVDAFLAATHNTNDATTVNMYTSIALLVSSIAQAGIQAGLPPAQVQSNVSAALTTAVVPVVAANATVATTPTTTP